jgi:hypothetical protein
LHQAMGDQAGALPLIRRAMEVWRTALGEDHPNFGTGLRNFVWFYAATGRAREAMPSMEQATAIDDRMIGQVFAIGSGRQRIVYLNTILGNLPGFLSLVLQHLSDSRDAIQAAFELVVRRKAVVAEALATQRDALLGGRYTALEPRLRDLTALRMQIARKTLAGPGPEGLEPHLRALADWEAQKERLEAELVRQIPEMNLEQKLRAADRRAYHFHRLPGTRAEGERVAMLLDVSPWLDANALAGRVKTACRSPRILHLATHGFFLPDQERDLNREGRGLGVDFGGFSGARDGQGRLSGPMMENRMLRSGLALAGANTWLRAGNPPEEAEDGLLTAEDVTGLDLLATELVVLSACETGLGQAHVGEGVFGLRRAFVLAGARTLVMSLWKVPDEPTRELMEDFYRRLLGGEGRAEALRQSQLAMKAKYSDPFYWGAFICQGDPSPLGAVRPESTGAGVATD